MAKLSSIVYGSAALVILFILASTMIIPYFATTHEHGFGTEPCMKDGCDSSDTGESQINPYCSGASSTVIACTNCNISTGYETFLASCYRLAPVNAAQTDAWMNNTHCYQCTDFGFKTTSQGLNLLVLVMALIMFAVIFIPKFRR